MNTTCFVIDDEFPARKLVESYISNLPGLQLAGSFGNPLEAIKAVREREPDLLFLDHQMPGLNGMDLLRGLTNRPVAILITAHAEQAADGYQLDVADYLLKPVRFERFVQAVNKAQERISQKRIAPLVHSKEFIFVKDGQSLVRLSIPDIIYVEGMKEYIRFHTNTGKVMTLMPLKKAEEMLPSHLFVRIHKSIIINLSKIDAVNSNQVQIGKHHFTIGATYKDAFLQMLNIK